MRRAVIMVLTGLLSALFFSGCNTIEGFGKDVKKGGEAIEKAADKARG